MVSPQIVTTMVFRQVPMAATGLVKDRRKRGDVAVLRGQSPPKKDPQGYRIQQMEAALCESCARCFKPPVQVTIASTVPTLTRARGLQCGCPSGPDVKEWSKGEVSTAHAPHGSSLNRIVGDMPIDSANPSEICASTWRCVPSGAALRSNLFLSVSGARRGRTATCQGIFVLSVCHST